MGLINSRFAFIAVCVVLLGWAGWRFVLPVVWASGHGPPVPLDVDPMQTPLEPPERVAVTRGDRHFTIEKTHHYEVSGEVLSATAYDVTWSNEFFDVDVGLLWGPSRERFKEKYHFSQMGRWLFWRSETPVTDAERDDITRHISNNHLIPAEGRKHLASAVRWVSSGDHVKITGSLVRVLDETGAQLVRSSTVREDSGDGACEVIWVDSLQINGRVYR